jgi:hypothetical protein
MHPPWRKPHGMTVWPPLEIDQAIALGRAFILLYQPAIFLLRLPDPGTEIQEHEKPDIRYRQLFTVNKRAARDQTVQPGHTLLRDDRLDRLECNGCCSQTSSVRPSAYRNPSAIGSAIRWSTRRVHTSGSRALLRGLAD